MKLFLAIIVMSTIFFLIIQTMRSSAKESAPLHETPFDLESEGLRIWIGNASGIFAVGDTGNLIAHQWDDNQLQRVPLPNVDGKSIRVRYIGAGIVIANLREDTGHVIHVYNDINEEPTVKIPLKEGEYLSGVGVSMNGRFGAFMCPIENESNQWSVLLMNFESNEVIRFPKLTIRADLFRTVAVSNDGGRIAVLPVNNGVMVIDAKKQEVLWSERPPSAISTTYGVFSQDGKVIYATGSSGKLFCIDAETGALLWECAVNENPQARRGHRATAIFGSPNGKYVAVGTGPIGLVFLMDSETSEVIKVYNHGHSHGLLSISALSFSPDSSRLASLAGGLVKTWDVEPRVEE